MDRVRLTSSRGRRGAAGGWLACDRVGNPAPGRPPGGPDGFKSGQPARKRLTLHLPSLTIPTHQHSQQQHQFRMTSTSVPGVTVTG